VFIFHSYFRKFEKYFPDPQYPEVDASARGSEGPVRVGYFTYISRVSKEFITACVNTGIPFNPDFNGPAGTIGVNRVSNLFIYL
jgi:choline dehydrogenase